jgi:hypothetical protein
MGVAHSTIELSAANRSGSSNFLLYRQLILTVLIRNFNPECRRREYHPCDECDRYDTDAETVARNADRRYPS